MIQDHAAKESFFYKGIVEYSDVGSTQRGVVNIALEPPVAVQTIEVGATSVVSDPMSDSTVIIKLQSDQEAIFDVGPEPDASNSTRKLVAGVEKTIAIPPGKSDDEKQRRAATAE